MSRKVPDAVRYHIIFRTGNCRLLMPDYSVAPICETVIFQSTTRIKQGALELYLNGIGVVSPRGDIVGYIDEISWPDTLWRAGEVLKRLGPYEPIRIEVIQSCCRAVTADQDPKNKSAQLLIEWAVDLIGASTYHEIMNALPPRDIVRYAQKLKQDFWAQVKKRDAKERRRPKFLYE